MQRRVGRANSVLQMQVHTCMRTHTKNTHTFSKLWTRDHSIQLYMPRHPWQTIPLLPAPTQEQHSKTTSHCQQAATLLPQMHLAIRHRKAITMQDTANIKALWRSKHSKKKKNKRTKNCEQQQNCLSTSVYEFFKQKVWKVCPYPPLLFLLLKTPAHWLSVVRCWYIQLLHCNTISQPFDIIFYGSHWEQNFTDTPCSWLYCLQNNWPPLSLWQQAKKNKKYMYIYIYMF